jgi:hypothetical protein
MQGGQSYCFPQLTTMLSLSCSCLVRSSLSKVGQFSFECCPLVQEISSVIHYLPWFERWLIAVFVHWGFSAENLVLCLTTFLWGRFSVLPIPSAVHVWLQLAVCFSVLWGSSVWDAALWLRRSSLWSTTCPALGGSLLLTCSQPLLPFLCLQSSFNLHFLYG